jgi:hypothetical protein
MHQLNSPLLSILLTASRLTSTAWSHDDDLETDDRPGRRGFRRNQGKHRRSPFRRKMILNSGGCGPSWLRHHGIVLERAQKLTRILLWLLVRRVLRARPDHREPRVGRALLWEVPRIRRPCVPLRQGWGRPWQARDRRESGEPAQECR